MTENQRATAFYKKHQEEGCFLMPNAWDAGSAKMLVSAGFEAIGTTSAGIAFSRGRPDNGFCSEEARLTRQEMLQEARSITQSVNVPVNVDLEAGFGDEPNYVAETIRLAIEAGAAGGNIEDYTGNLDCPLYDLELAIERIKAARAAILKANVPFVLAARTDEMNAGHSKNLDEAIERANLYYEAGADCLFVPGVSDKPTVSTLVKEIVGPINVVMGLSGSDVSFQELAELGVRRVSIGGSLARAMYFHIRQAAAEMMQEGTFSFAKNQISQDELNQIFQR